jgi:prephenate dehydrogenase
MIQTATIVGCCGGFGRAFVELLHRRGLTLHGADVLPASERPVGLADYRQLDARDCDWLALGAAEPHRLVLLCVPQDIVITSFHRLLPSLGPDTLAADIVSVKSRVASAFASCRTAGQYVSLHPMFGPSADLRGRNVASIPLAYGPLVAELEAVLRSEGATVSRMTTDEHDRGVAVTQVLVHAALLSLGLASRDANVPATTTDAVSTPVHLVLQSLLARLCSGDPSLYAHIQRDNPHAADARRLLRVALDRFDAAARDDSRVLEELIASAASDDPASALELGERVTEAARTSHAGFGEVPQRTDARPARTPAPSHPERSEGSCPSNAGDSSLRSE